MSLTFAVRGQTVVQDVHGEAVRSAHIEVRAPDGTLAVLYDGRTRGSTVANPTTADTFGQLTFYSDQAGVYTLNVTTPAGVFARSVEAEVDAADLAYAADVAQVLATAEAYTDAAINNRDFKDDVRAATTASIALSGLQTVDTVVLAAGDRVLVKDQATASQNGIYAAASGAWARTADADSGAELVGAAALVREGNANKLSMWLVTNDGPITLGTTAVVWEQTSGGGAGAGTMNLTGDQTATGNKQFDTVRTKKGPMADPIMWALTDITTGVNDAKAAILAAQADSGNARLSPGTYRVASSMTLTGSWRFASGAKLKPDNGVTITVQATEMNAGRYQIFDLSAGGLVSWDSTVDNADRRVKVEWWGAVPGSNPSGAQATANRVAIQAAFDVPSSTRAASTVSFARGCRYIVDQGLLITQQAVKLEAKGVMIGYNATTWTGPVSSSLLTLGTFATNALTLDQQQFVSGWAAEQASTIAQHDNGDGTFALDITSTDLGEVDAISTVNVPVTAGLSYTATAVFQAISVATDLPDVGVAIVWLDSGGVELSRSYGVLLTSDQTSLTGRTVTVTAPTGAAFANMELRIVGVTNIGDSVRVADPVLGATSKLVPNFIDLDKLSLQVDGNNPTTKKMHSLVKNMACTFLRWDWGRLIAGLGADYCFYPGDYNPVEFHLLEMHTGSALLDGVHIDGGVSIASPPNGSFIGKGKHQGHQRLGIWARRVANLTIDAVDISQCVGGAIRMELCGGCDIRALYTENCGPNDTRPITLVDTLGVPTLQLLLTTKANTSDVSITVQAGTSPNTFKLVVLYRGTSKEVYDNLVMDSASAFYAITKMAKSAYVIASDLHSASASPANQPALVTAVQNDTTQLPNTTKILELVNCNAIDITGRINAGGGGAGVSSANNYAALYMTGTKGVKYSGVVKNAVEWDVYADDTCADIDITDVVSSPLTTNAAPALKIRIPTSLETTRIYIPDTGLLAPAKRYDRPGTLTNLVTQPARLSAWTAVGGGGTIMGTATAPDGTGVVDILRLPANTADSTVGRITTTAVIAGTASAAQNVVVRFFARRNARVGYAFGEAACKVQVNRSDGQRMLTVRCPLGDQPHLFEFLLNTNQKLTYGLTPTALAAPGSDVSLTMRVANAISTDQVDVEVWGVQIAPAGTPYVIDPEVTSAFSGVAYGPVARGPRVTMFRGVLRREIITAASPQTASLAPPLGDSQWRLGDIAWNSAFDGASTPLGWVCTVAGNPGTWVAFGNPAVAGHSSTRTITGSDSLVLADDGQIVEANAAGAVTLTVPTNASVAFPLNAEIEVYQQGAGQVTVAAAGGVTLRTPNGARTAQQYSTIGLRYRGSDIWVVSGDTTP